MKGPSSYFTPQTEDVKNKTRRKQEDDEEDDEETRNFHSVEEVATENPERETLNGRLHLFLSSLLASLGSVFGHNEEEEGGGGGGGGGGEEEEEEELKSEMASRAAVVPKQPRGGGGKQKNGEAEGRNRRVLRDIGNITGVPVGDGGKPQNQICRPITRSLCVQLQANPRAAEEKNKKPLAEVVNGSGAVNRVVARKDGSAIKAAAADKKRHDEEGKSDKVIDTMSSDEGGVVIMSKKEEKQVISRKSGVGPSRKEVKTMTWILTARSKAACGLKTRPKEPIIPNIDAADCDNELAVVEYVEDIYKFYKLTEDENRVRDYMDSQPDINSKMRSILIDWLTEVHRKFELMPETLFLTLNLVDRYLSVTTISRRELQLVGISSMLIACKYEEIWAPEVNDFIAISDNAYVREQILIMEKAILGKLEWYLTVPTPYVFLVRYIKASVLSVSDQEMESMVFFLVELGLMHYPTIILYCSSMIAASAVYAARCTLNRNPLWTETLKHHTGYSEDRLGECAKLLVRLHSDAGESKLKAVHKKYSSPDRGSVALFPPAKSVLIAAAPAAE